MRVPHSRIEGSSVSAAYIPSPVVDPTDLRPVADRAGTTWRFYVVDHTTLILRARLEHDAASASIGASL